jgi:16S rRNA (adenine1518-N6/adenine1519-N6)-dimethyltransferase
MKHRARKRFGQNFLQDAHIISRIIDAIAPKANDNLIEIGPGLGALTDLLLQRLEQLTVIEIDRDLIAKLKERNLKQLTIIEKDVLTVDFASLDKQHLRIIGNLPYNISTPLLFHLLRYHHLIDDMFFMLQKELVERITAPVNDKNYGRLSVMLQYYCETDYLFTVPATAFKPVPKVESAIIRLRPKKQRAVTANNEEAFTMIVKSAFAHRRKTINNNLKELISQETFASLGISPQKRAQDLSVADYVSLSNAIKL